MRSAVPPKFSETAAACVLISLSCLNFYLGTDEPAQALGSFVGSCFLAYHQQIKHLGKLSQKKQERINRGSQCQILCLGVNL